MKTEPFRKHVKTLWAGEMPFQNGYFEDPSPSFEKARKMWCQNDNVIMVITNGAVDIELRSLYFRDKITKIYEQYKSPSDQWYVVEIVYTKRLTIKDIRQLWS